MAAWYRGEVFVALGHRDTSKSAPARRRSELDAAPEVKALPTPSQSGWIQLATRTGASKAGCSCGGGCPKCKQAQGIEVGPANDAYEREADSLADRLVAGASVSTAAREGPVLRTKPGADAGTSTRPSTLPGLGAGRALPSSLASEFGSRLGRSLEGVRIHTDSSAHAAASALGARAFTHGRDLVFGAGEWSPITREGRHLIAHELVHWAQQGGRSDRIQRRLKVDAAASDDPASAISMIQPLISRLCDGFTIHGNGEITADTSTKCGEGNFAAVAAAPRHVGCCCLCTLVRAPGTAWRIIVSNANAPTTSSSGRVVRMTPTGPAAPTFRAWSGGATQRRIDLPPEEAFGHELCGHAALMEIHAHPSSSASTPDRAFSDIHDPTVRVENQLAGEMGIAGPRRGLANSGSHRGESLRVFTIQPFTAGSANPSAASAPIAAATAFMNANTNLLADVVGFQAGAEVPAGLALDRAQRVHALLVAGVTASTVSVDTPSGPTTVPRIQPALDGGFGSPKVEINMAARPAGLQVPVGPTPPSPAVHVGAEHPAAARMLIAGTGVNACHNLLAKIAWAGATP